MTSGNDAPLRAAPPNPEPEHPQPRRLGRNAATTSLGALGGIAAGLLLDVAIAATFGAGPATDSLFVAMRLPVGLTAVIMAGANQALVPMFSRWQIHKTTRAFSRSVSVVLFGSLVAGSVVAGLGMLLAYPLMAITAPGMSAPNIERAAALARIMFWLIPLVTGAEVFRSYMNSRHRFGVPAAMGIVMNGLAAAIVIVWSPHRVAVAAWAYVVGALVQLIFMACMASLVGLRLTPTLALRDPELASVARVSARPLAAAALNPLVRVVEQMMISFLPAGSITILNYSNRLISAIGGTVLFRSVMVVLLPRLTEAWERRATDEVLQLARTGMALMLRLSLPLTVLIVVLGRPGALVVFHRGQFTRTDALALGTCLAVYAFSLVGQAEQRALLAPFYARLSMKIPWRNSVYGVVANLALLPVLVLPFEHRSGLAALIGVAVAFSASQYVNVAHAWWHLHRLLGPVMDRRLAVNMLWTTAAAGACGGAMVLGSIVLDLNGDWSRLELLGRTVLVGVVGLGVFALVLLPTRNSVAGAGRGRHAVSGRTDSMPAA